MLNKGQTIATAMHYVPLPEKVQRMVVLDHLDHQMMIK
jgi:hypothetical protein